MRYITLYHIIFQKAIVITKKMKLKPNIFLSGYFFGLKRLKNKVKKYIII